MTSVLTCPSCERRLQVPESLVGEKVKCPTCGALFMADLDSPSPQPVTGPAVRDSRPPAPPREKEREAPAPGRHDEELPRRPDDDEEDEEDRPRRRRRRQPPAEKPGKVQAVGVMMLVGGILAVVLFLGLGAGSTGACCLWPGTYYSLVMGIFAIIKGAALLGDDVRLQEPPRGTAIMMIVNAANLDFVNVALGIVCLVFLNEPEVARYFRQQR